MAEFLLNKIINDEINYKKIVSWILDENLEVDDPDFQEILACKIRRIDFVTYFLNFVHEEIPCRDTICQTPRKLSTPKHIDQNLSTPKICSNNSKNHNKRTNLFKIQSNEESIPSNKSCELNNSIENSCSPKRINKSLNASHINENNYHMSPVSPLYRNQNNFTPKDQKIQNTVWKSSEKSNVCLGDFIVTAKSSSKKKKGNLSIDNSLEAKKTFSRRINPTNLNLKTTNDAFQKSENSFNFKENSESPVILNNVVDNTRSILVEERLKILTKKEEMVHIAPKKVCSVFKSEVGIEPKLCDVSFKKHLDYIIDIYVNVLTHRLVLNITSEMHFLISLLLSKQDDRENVNSKIENFKLKEELNLGVNFLEYDKQSTLILEESSFKSKKKHLYNSEIFESIHNIVYFASKCLETQIEILKCLDKASLRLLAENSRLKEFSNDFCNQLLNISFKKSDRFLEPYNIEPQSNVCFNADTDNIQNFPDQLHFHAFRKQRDLFYEILRIWENNHILPEWQFALSLGGKIRSLFSLCQEPSNFVHLSRLFKDQLLNHCVKNNNKETGVSEKISTLPSSLANINSKKLNLLTNRLVTKPTTSGINSSPVFCGYQEFYKDFIVVAANHFFNRHLCDCFIANILDLNDSKIVNCDIDEQDSQVDVNTKKSYTTCMKNMRILAKFLGFIESMPYKSESLSNSKDLMQAHVEIRSQICPSLDIKSLLDRALENHTLILLIPWLTKYLALQDHVTLRLPYYQSVNRLLFEVYRRNNKQQSFSYNNLMIMFSLGWLFELPHFPEHEYFNYCSKSHEYVQKSPKNGYKQPKYLDNLDIVDQNILYLCCPYLEDIRKLLSSNMTNSNKVAVKHITPVTAVESSSEMVKRKIEQQLEDAFFNGQPASLRKTVEFVSERVASSAVKFFCHTLIPGSKENSVKQLRNMLKEVREGHESSSFEESQYKILLKRKSTQNAQIQLDNLILSCNKEMFRISSEKIPPALDSLLPLGSLPQTKDFCINVTIKMYAERVKQWVSSHVNLTIFLKDFDQEVQKVLLGRSEKEKIPFRLPSGGRESMHNEDAVSGFHILTKIQDLVCDITNTSLRISDDRIVMLLKETLRSIEERNDINDSMLSSICNTIFDLCVLLVAHRPLIFSAINLKVCISIWKHHPKLEHLCKNVFSPRNIIIIHHSKNKTESWNMLANVLTELVEARLFDVEDFESQCTGFYQREWSTDVLKQYSSFLKEVSTRLSKNGGCDEKFGFMLDFLSSFCSDL